MKLSSSELPKLLSHFMVCLAYMPCVWKTRTLVSVQGDYQAPLTVSDHCFILPLHVTLRHYSIIAFKASAAPIFAFSLNPCHSVTTVALDCNYKLVR